MGRKAIQIRPHNLNERELGQYLEELVGHPVPCTLSLPPIYFVVTSDENLDKLKEKYGDKADITSNDVEE
ncbi:hypothetical protein NM208_g2890 [Fusarium decemcellulare]|uniref:Uncharacterized protein n=1 Tax=Fusarium decemcellulare TaxID=57161 RepID=A0ACC1SR70_9HYPO|nr:hypothetical protein NM208_g2890 [Fusarium decemcellulare]